MTNQNKPRLSDVAKKNTTDRASKLAQSFVPPPPVQSVNPPPGVEPSPTPEPAVAGQMTEPNERIGEGQALPPEKAVLVAKEEPATVSSQPIAAKERRTRTSPRLDVVQALTQPAPEGLRCNRPTMLSEVHHDWLRELGYTQKKPMTVLLYNMLELLKETYQQQKQTE